MASMNDPSKDRAAEIDAALTALFDALSNVPPPPEVQARIDRLLQGVTRLPKTVPSAPPALPGSVGRRAS